MSDDKPLKDKPLFDFTEDDWKKFKEVETGKSLEQVLKELWDDYQNGKIK